MCVCVCVCVCVCKRACGGNEDRGERTEHAGPTNDSGVWDKVALTDMLHLSPLSLSSTLLGRGQHGGKKNRRERAYVCECVCVWDEFFFFAFVSSSFSLSALEERDNKTGTQLTRRSRGVGVKGEGGLERNREREREREKEDKESRNTKINRKRFGERATKQRIGKNHSTPTECDSVPREKKNGKGKKRENVEDCGRRYVVESGAGVGTISPHFTA